MKTSFHRIYTKDNIELAGLLYEPESKTKKVLCFVHGMAGNFYENKFLSFIAETLTDNNIAFFVFNNTGCELIKDLYKIVNSDRKIVRIGGAYEKFEDSVFDIQSAINFLEKEGFDEIHLGGHSLGSPKVAYYISKTADKRIKSVLFVSPSDMLGLVRKDKKRFEMDIKEALEMKKSGKGNELMTRSVWDECPVSASTYLSLFADDSKAAIFNFLEHNDQLDTLNKIKQPIFIVMGRKDDVLIVPIEEIMERITKAARNSSKVETKILGDANHGYIGFEQQLADAILEWLTLIY